jgi:uncharacterized protein YbaR (Trm112 family)
MQESSANLPAFDQWTGQLACPACLDSLRVEDGWLVCTGCARAYPVVDGIPVLIVERAQTKL